MERSKIRSGVIEVMFMPLKAAKVETPPVRLSSWEKGAVVTNWADALEILTPWLVADKVLCSFSKLTPKA